MCVLLLLPLSDLEASDLTDVNNTMSDQTQSILTDIRSVSVTYDSFGYADASALFELGNTKILCSVSLQHGVPTFLRGKEEGWLTAEYAMLPCATHRRRKRDIMVGSKNGRGVEIARLIGRCLRSVCSLEELGERTIVVDCDVLQADGGTRVASITAASLVLQLAQSRWIASGLINKAVLAEPIAAISAGLVDGKVKLDLGYEDDSSADADFNFVMTRSGALVEVQGTAERNPIPWQTFEQLKAAAQHGITLLFSKTDTFVPENLQPTSSSSALSLGNRLQ